MNDGLVSQALNQVLFAASCLSDLVDMRKWSIDINKISRSNVIIVLA